MAKTAKKAEKESDGGQFEARDRPVEAPAAAAGEIPGDALDESLEIDPAIAKALLETLRLERGVLIDKIEAEILRHERAFDGVLDGTTVCTPEHSPQQLHDLRLTALSFQGDATSSVAALRNVLAELAAIAFDGAAR